MGVVQVSARKQAEQEVNAAVARMDAAASSVQVQVLRSSIVAAALLIAARQFVKRRGNEKLGVVADLLDAVFLFASMGDSECAALFVGQSVLS